VQAIVEEIKRQKLEGADQGGQDAQVQGGSTLKKKRDFVTHTWLTGTDTGFKAVQDRTLSKLLLSPEVTKSVLPCTALPLPPLPIGGGGGGGNFSPLQVGIPGKREKENK